jgi:mRNA-degrading endonuclease RelE of RelBE toxin-antitoxin system
MKPNPLATWELRLGDLRVFYDLDDDEQAVIVVAVGMKIGNRVQVGGEEIQL